MIKYTKELLQPIVEQSKSYSEVLRRLGKRQSGSLHQHLKKVIKKHDLSTDHFLGCGHAKGKVSNKKKLPKEILVERVNDSKRQCSYILRRAMLESGVPYACKGENCSVSKTWLGKSIRLQAHHKNGNWLDDRLGNLEFLCPNCHSQTENWCNQ
jgi:hypothetical protein